MLFADDMNTFAYRWILPLTLAITYFSALRRPFVSDGASLSDPEMYTMWHNVKLRVNFKYLRDDASRFQF